MAKRPTLGEILKEARNFKRVTLREAEDKTKISNAYLSQLESDAVKDPSPHKLHTLAKYFGVEYSLLMEAAGYIMPSKDQKQNTLNSTQALLLREQSLTEEESKAMAAFLVNYRQMNSAPNHHKPKRESK